METKPKPDEGTLFDYFAAKAMEGMVAGHFAHHGHELYWDRNGIAVAAFDLAQAMLDERQRRVK